MHRSTKEAEQQQQGKQNQATEAGTIPFNKSYPGRLAEPARLALNPMERLAFDACLELAWRIDFRDSGKWLGCLRKKRQGPYTNRELARAFGTGNARASNHIKELKRVGLLEIAIIDNQKYLRVTDFPARMNGSFYESFGRPWDDGPAQGIAQKAILLTSQVPAPDCSESNLGGDGNCSEGNSGGAVDCSESNSGKTEIAQKAIDPAPGGTSGDQQPQALKGSSDHEIGADQICTYQNVLKNPDPSSSDAVVGGFAASTTDDEKGLVSNCYPTALKHWEEAESWLDPEADAYGQVRNLSEALPVDGEPRADPATGSTLPRKTACGGAADAPSLSPAPPSSEIPDERMRRFLVETMGVMDSRVDDLMSRVVSLPRLKQVSHLARANGNSNPGAYLCTCLEAPHTLFWQWAAEGWEKERRALRREVDRTLREGKLGYEWRTYLTTQILADEAAYLYDLEPVLEEIEVSQTLDGKPLQLPTLLDAMHSMWDGGDLGRSDNAVLGGVQDYDEASPVIRLLTNYGVPLTKAFVSIVEPETGVDQALSAMPPAEQAKAVASSAARAPYPDFIDPSWAEDLGLSIPLTNPDRANDYLCLHPSSETMVNLRERRAEEQRKQDRRALEAAHREEERRRAKAEQQRLQELKTNPKYDPLPEEVGTLCEEIGTVLNERGIAGVLVTYGFSLGFEFMQKLYRRQGLNERDVERVIVNTLNRVHQQSRRDLLEQMVAVTVSHAPYPQWFSQPWNAWWRMVMDSAASKWQLQPPSSYPHEGMRDFTSLKDLTNKYKLGKPDEPYVEAHRPDSLRY